MFEKYYQRNFKSEVSFLPIRRYSSSGFSRTRLFFSMASHPLRKSRGYGVIYKKKNKVEGGNFKNAYSNGFAYKLNIRYCIATNLSRDSIVFQTNFYVLWILCRRYVGIIAILHYFGQSLMKLTLMISYSNETVKLLIH